MRFESPFFLVLLVFPVGYLLIKYLFKKLPVLSPSINFSSLYLISRKELISAYYNIISDLLINSALIFFIIALARPLGGSAIKSDEMLGIDIVLCLDVSGSMLNYDGFPTHLPYRDILDQRIYYDFKKTLFPGNRLNSAKRVLIDYIDKQEFNRIGLVVFAGYSYTKSPLTLDKKMLKNLVSSIEFDPANDGTAIGMGIATSINRIKNSKAKSKIIILLTDGNNNTGLIEPLTAATIATNYGIKIYTIGLGNKEGFLQPANLSCTEYILRPGEGLDENILRQIAEITGGKFFRAYEPETLKKIYDEIDKLEKSKIEIKRRVMYRENYFPFLVTGFVFLAAFIIFYGMIIKVP
ncbi:MAG: VWA domain-containing protein [Brevinematia bacterium]